MINKFIEQLQYCGVEVLHNPDNIPLAIQQYISSETNALYVYLPGTNRHYIYLLRTTIDFSILVHETIHYLQKIGGTTLAFLTPEEIYTGFPHYLHAVRKAYVHDTHSVHLQETEAHVIQNHPQLVFDKLCKI